MKCLFLTFLDPTLKAGLFISTHERIKNSIPLLDNYFVANIMFYDSYLVKFIKRVIGIQVKDKGNDFFIFDGIRYKNLWFKRGLLSSVTPWGRFDKLRIAKIICNENFIKNKIHDKDVLLIKDFDYIMAHWGYPVGKIALRLSRIYGIPYFVTFHGSDINVMPNVCNVIRIYVKEVLEGANLNFFVSNALLSKAQELFHLSNYEVSYNGISEKFLIRKQKHHSDSHVSVLFIGNLNDDKRADFLPAIIKTILHKYSHTISFTIIGKGKYETYLKEELKNIQSNVVLTGQIERESVLSYFQEADVLILPSRREGMPLVVLEAIACGVIPVASNVGGLSEILESNFLVNDSENFVEDFACKVVSIIEKRTIPELQVEKFIWKNILSIEMSKIFNSIR